MLNEAYARDRVAASAAVLPPILRVHQSSCCPLELLPNGAHDSGVKAKVTHCIE
jgi:hypothetical protein